MRGKRGPSTKSLSLIMIFLLGVSLLTIGVCQPVAALRSGRLLLAVGKSRIIKSKMPISRVSVAAPDVADYVLLSPQQVYVTGKSPGVTNLTLWGEDDKVAAIYDLEVAPDSSVLKEKLHQIFPAEKDVRVTAAPDSVILSGTVSNTTTVSEVVDLAKNYAPKNKVINLLQVAGVQQVMLEVRVAEMSRTLTRELGFNFIISKDGNNFGVSLLNGLTSFENDALGGISTLSPAINALFRITGGSLTWTQFIDALKTEGMVKILAEPNLMAMSGQSASFLVGGEFPYPVPQGLGTVAIEYKSFGVGLTFTPTVLSNDRINMVVAPEVSNLDFGTTTQVGLNLTVPSISTRRASTVVQLADGQSFAIAGLFRTDINEIASKFPFLGDIPILGALFRSTSFQKNETELVIIVTPHLVKPLDMAKQTLPGSTFIEPDDCEFFLLGVLQGRQPTLPSAPPMPPLGQAGGMEGKFGHSMP